VWVPTVFTKNRDRLLEADVARKFLAELIHHKELRGLLSDEHFSVDGTQIAAWASMKSFKPKDGSGTPPGPGRNGERDFHGEKPSNATHASSTDAEAQLRKGGGKEAKLSFIGHVLMVNRSGLIVATTLTKATGTAEREAAEEMIVRHSPGARRKLESAQGPTMVIARGNLTVERLSGRTKPTASPCRGMIMAIPSCSDNHLGGVSPPSRDRKAALAERAGLNAESYSLQHRCELSVSRGVSGIDPYDHHGGARGNPQATLRFFQGCRWIRAANRSALHGTDSAKICGSQSWRPACNRGYEARLSARDSSIPPR
jgi:hypothetical protein